MPYKPDDGIEAVLTDLDIALIMNQARPGETVQAACERMVSEQLEALAHAAAPVLRPSKSRLRAVK